MQDVNDIHGLVRNKVFESLWPDHGICFSLYQTEDAGPGLMGDLFHQEKDFLMVEVRVDDVVQIGPGIHELNRVFGGLEISYHTKDRLDEIGAKRKLEECGKWFARKTLDGVRFRTFVPTGDGRDRGFQTYAGTVVFEFETQPTRE